MNATVRLPDDQLDALADRIAERLRAQSAGALVDAATLADRLGVARGWVYEHASELGARRLGGPRGRLRFDTAEAAARFTTVVEPEKHTKPPRPRRRSGGNVGSILAVRR